MTTATARATDVVIELEQCQKYFPVTRGIVIRQMVGQVKAVDGISFQIRQGQTYSLVGESGCGKTTTAKMIMRAVRPDAGEVRFALNGALENVHGFSEKLLTDYRRQVQFIFQDP
jgi:ABC-type oligopeptide transport system ATPase subunit